MFSFQFSRSVRLFMMLLFLEEKEVRWYDIMLIVQELLKQYMLQIENFNHSKALASLCLANVNPRYHYPNVKIWNYAYGTILWQNNCYYLPNKYLPIKRKKISNRKWYNSHLFAFYLHKTGTEDTQIKTSKAENLASKKKREFRSEGSRSWVADGQLTVKTKKTPVAMMPG